MRGIFVVVSVVLSMVVGANPCSASSISEETDACLSCHVTVTPGIVADWEKSRHAKTSPREALQQMGLELKVSAQKIPERLLDNSVGCAECHTLNSEKHKDSFEHEGHKVHIVVSPPDCATCHRVEVDQFAENLMSHGHVNLVRNVLYQDLIRSINGDQTFKDAKITLKGPNAATDEESCLSCHGTAVEVTGRVTRKTEMGDMEFPRLSGWPNQGVGRLNPDGSQGSCAACHTRHQFSMEMARKPHTCAECHKGPDVPAYKVYEVSKHGNIYKSLEKEWDFKAVPWTVGKDFTAPTCAACHMSLTVSEEGQVIAERSHRMSERLPWRIFGLVYAHAHPKSPDLTGIMNKAGLPLPTELTGEPVGNFLIDAAEQEKRRNAMQTVCLSCHGSSWVEGHWARFENTIKTSNGMTRTATDILLTAWEKGLAKGLAQHDSVFNEAIEKRWVEQWLFYANSVRFSSAMCGADYGVFENGRWHLSKNIQEMKDWLDIRLKMRR